MLIAQRHMHDGAWICFNASEIVYIHNHTYTHTHIYISFNFISYYHIMLLLYITDITVSSIQYSPTLSKAFLLPVLQTMLERWDGAYA